MPTYSWQAPDGKTLSVTQDNPPTPRQMQQLARAYGDRQAADAQGRAESRASAQGDEALSLLPVVGGAVGGMSAGAASGGLGGIAGTMAGAGGGRLAAQGIKGLLGIPTPDASGIVGDAAGTMNEAGLWAGATEAGMGGLRALGNWRQILDAAGGEMAAHPWTAMNPVRQAGQLMQYLGRERPPGPLLTHGPGTSAPVAEPTTAPHLDLTRRIQPGGFTQAQIAERSAAIDAARAEGQTVEFGPLKADKPRPTAAEHRGRGLGVDPMGPENAPAAPPIEIVEKPAPKPAAKKTKTARERRATPKAQEPRSDIERAFSNLKLTPEEAQEAVKLLEKGMPADKVLERITMARDLSGKLGTPTVDEVAKDWSYRKSRGGPRDE